MQWRYTEWLRWDTVGLAGDWSKPHAVELYDHADDDGTDFDRFENANLAGQPAVAAEQAALAAELRQAFPLRSGWAPPMPPPTPPSPFECDKPSGSFCRHEKTDCDAKKKDADKFIGECDDSLAACEAQCLANKACTCMTCNPPNSTETQDGAGSSAGCKLFKNVHKLRPFPRHDSYVPAR